MKNTKEMTKCAMCVAILCMASYFVIPLPFTPVVLGLQTVMINLIGLILEPRAAGCTIGIYLLMGLVGLPVFSGGTAGIGKLFGPTGGFYFGFLISAVLISLLKGQKRSLRRYLLVTLVVGLPIQHICAVLMMCCYNGFHVVSAIMTVSIPFLAGDILKCILASVLGDALQRIR